MRIFVAGASGAIGQPLIAELIRRGHEVTGMTRSEAGARNLADRGAAVARVSAFDAAAVEQALRDARPEVVIDELTSLPRDPSELAAAAPGDRKLKIEGGGNLHRAAMACGVRRYIQQASGFFLEPGSGLADESAGLAVNASPRVAANARAYAELEARVLNAGEMEGVALRYGFFYGPGTWYHPDGASADQVRRQELPVGGEHPRLYRGHGRFVAPRQIQVGNEILEGERIFINTGTRPEIPRIEGLDGAGYLTNATIMELTEIPEHLLVIGGGYIGLEFGQMFRRFGSRVTVVHRDEQILPREDADVAGELQKVLEAEGMQFILKARTIGAKRRGKEVALTVEAGDRARTLAGSHLLVAAGRRPNSDDLGLEKAGVQTDQRGYIMVNSRLETNVPGIWAMGDVKGGPAFTHISYHDYQILSANLAEGKKLAIDNRLVPYSVFTDPQLGRVGMTEGEARAAKYRLKIGKIPMEYVARAIERDETAGLMKLVVDADSDRVLGAAILSVEGGELIQILSTLMLANASYTLLQGAIYIHPTLAEGFYTLMEDVKPMK
jgi:pyruvate/2-oxoglutarate dehydrogenase complex dihydrolipoamide dehydrogenase (E3) component